MSGTIRRWKGRRARQGCILATLLFNLYINPLMPRMNNPIYDRLKLKVIHIAMFLYAIISHTNWTKVSFTCFSCRRSTEAFKINQAKTKLLLFAKCPQIHGWQLNKHPNKQVKNLSIRGSVSCNWPMQSTNMLSQKLTISLRPFYYIRGITECCTKIIFVQYVGTFFCLEPNQD